MIKSEKNILTLNNRELKFNNLDELDKFKKELDEEISKVETYLFEISKQGILKEKHRRLQKVITDYVRKAPTKKNLKSIKVGDYVVVKCDSGFGYVDDIPEIVVEVNDNYIKIKSLNDYKNTYNYKCKADLNIYQSVNATAYYIDRYTPGLKTDLNVEDLDEIETFVDDF